MCTPNFIDDKQVGSVCAQQTCEGAGGAYSASVGTFCAGPGCYSTSAQCGNDGSCRFSTCLGVWGGAPCLTSRHEDGICSNNHICLVKV